MRRLALFFALCLLPVLAPAADTPAPNATPTHPEPPKKNPMPLTHYVLVPEESKLKFVAIQNSAPVEGAFGKFSADIHFSPDDLDHSTITAEVDVTSIFTAYPELAKELVKEEWLDTAHFPKATLKTTAIHAYPPRNNDDRRYYYADSDLTVHGKTAQVMLDFVMERLDKDGAVAEGRMAMKRHDFDVGQGKWKNSDAVDDVVSLNFRVAAKRVNP